MGGGSYTITTAQIRATNYLHQNREEIFSQRTLHPDMNISGKIRECVDCDEHPSTFPIIIALDVTGSMGMVPEYLIKEGFPNIMKKILDEGVLDPQVCFIGIGDQYTDKAPIQVGQFEASDELLDKWLKNLYLEGGGGGNGGESYQLAWAVAARHTTCDHIKKGRGKGVLITIGDDAVHKSIASSEFNSLYGNSYVSSITTSALLEEAKQSWDIYHINLRDYLGSTSSIQSSWKILLGEHLINTEGGFGRDIPDIISSIILNSYKSNNLPIESMVEEPTISIEHHR